jgi:hypothetical protein
VARDLTWELPLAEIIRRYARIRRPPAERVGTGGFRGWEARLEFATVAELESAREALREAGIRPGRPYAQGSRVVLPVYGRAGVARLLRLQREAWVPTEVLPPE